MLVIQHAEKSSTPVTLLSRVLTVLQQLQSNDDPMGEHWPFVNSSGPGVHSVLLNCCRKAKKKSTVSLRVISTYKSSNCYCSPGIKHNLPTLPICCVSNLPGAKYSLPLFILDSAWLPIYLVEFRVQWNCRPPHSLLLFDAPFSLTTKMQTIYGPVSNSIWRCSNATGLGDNILHWAIQFQAVFVD